MASYRLCFVLVILIVKTCAVYEQEDIIKSSLTFVIDDTASMADEIRQVKEEVNIIFEKVMSSKASQIENFVLVTFNDPTAELRTITKDRNVFKSAVAAISVNGGGDCPEYAMTGIELGLTESLPQSYLYVFTDASAKDHAMFERIKSISQKKQSQVVFILTGECGSKSGADYQVYHKVAEVTNGQVFHMMKNDVKDILKYIEESITGRGIPLVNKKLPPGTHTLTYPVDSHTGKVIISVTGTDPKIGEVIGPDGSKPTTEPIVSGKSHVAVTSVLNAIPGDHKVEVESKSDAHAIITANSDLNFQLGFAVFKPNSMKDTVTKPAPEGNAFLGIRLLGSGVIFTTAKILDMSDNVITDLPLQLVDEATKFYVTPSFNPPFTMFRVSVTGNDVKSKSPISRTSPTPISRQDPSTEKKVNTAPVITIDGAPSIITEYDAPLQLKCNVHGYPAPDITWEEKDTGIRMPAKVDLVEVPYDYVSILDIDKANKNITYQCKANNNIGVNIKYVKVETKRKIYLDVTEIPKDTRVEYNKEGKLTCKVDAYPPATITWYKDGTVVSGNITNVDISGDKSILTIKHMQPELQGKFTCEARNDFDRKVYIAEVNIFGVEEPVIDKSYKEIRVREKTNAALTCRILKGIPQPNIYWYFQPPGEVAFRTMTETAETIHLSDVGKDRTGSYKCHVQNYLGSDAFTMELVVEYPPLIKEDLKVITSKDDDEVRISCDVTGEPVPAVRWFFNGTTLDSTTRSRIAVDQSLRFKARLPDIGYYRCEAGNKLGVAKKTVFLNVFVPVTIERPKKSSRVVMVGKSTILNCRADGYPIPNIKWTFQSSDPMTPSKDVTPTRGVASVALKNMQLDQQGSYTCEAENGIGGSASITYDVKVYAPPVITNMYPVKVFEAVTGDLALRIQCKATGSPKPSIVWIKNGDNLAIGTDWYDMEDDGTLVIKNIERDAQGTYVCLAKNILGSDTEVYEVIIRDDLPEAPTNTVSVPENETVDIKCDIPHTNTDQMRWYRGNVHIANGELTLYSVTRSDDGLYTCRISDATRSRSVTTKVVVGYKPTFVTEEEETVQFIDGADSQFLSCEALGEPRPKTAIWKHNGKVLNTTSMSYSLGMEYGATGTYECDVSNVFGSIRRTFTVTSRDCILDLKKDFPEKQPIMLSSRSLDWPVFEVKDGFMIIPHHDYFYLNCPSLFSNSNLPSKKIITAFCEKDNIIKINGNLYNFAEIQCNEEVKPEVLKTDDKTCLPGNTGTVRIGYRLFTEFIDVYKVCLDKENNVPLYTKHTLSPTHTDRSAEAAWSNIALPQDFETLYDCRRQAYDIGSTLGRGLSTGTSCCFGKRQLVSSHDLLPGVPTAAAYDYLNVIPHWSTCSSKNWEDVEQSVRKLVKSAGRDLLITTGTAYPHRVRTSADITLHDGRGGSQTVAPYLWKVVQDRAQEASLAIIQVNIPELSEEEAAKHVLCYDICGSAITWLDPSNYHNVEDGYIYCCTITEFENAFGYNGFFNPEMRYVLFDAGAISELSSKK